MCFWNIAGITNKDNETWSYLKGFDVVGLTETWVEEGRWSEIKSKLPKNMEWRCNAATREHKKGRAWEGIITEVNRKIKETKYEEWTNNIVARRIRLKGKEWRIVVVYNREAEKTIEVMEKQIREEDEGTMIIGGDWNASGRRRHDR